MQPTTVMESCFTAVNAFLQRPSSAAFMCLKIGHGSVPYTTLPKSHCKAVNPSFNGTPVKQQLGSRHSGNLITGTSSNKLNPDFTRCLSPNRNRQ